MSATSTSAPQGTPAAPADANLDKEPPEPRPRAGLRERLREILPFAGRLADQEAARLLLSGVLVGVLGGLAAGVFDGAMVGIGRLLLGVSEPSTHAPVWWRALLGPTVGGLLASLVIRFLTRRGRPQGVADVMGRTQLQADTLSLREGLASATAAALAVGGGQSGGREGPIVQVASSLAMATCKLLRTPPRHFRALVASGAAAGVAASFNTPLGGAFFALEIILGDFALESFAPVVAATVTGTVMGQVLLGDRVALHLPAFELGSPVELLFYLVLGLFSGVVAVLFKRLIVAAPRGANALGLPLMVRGAVAGLAVGGAAALGLPQVMGNGYAWMELAISAPDQMGLGVLVLLVVAKPLASAITASGRSGAGLFAASLFLGAATGLAFGMAANAAFPSLVSSPGAYGMVGMGAVAAAVLHAPITLTLMLFEMTGNYEVILPLLLSLATAGFVSNMLGSESIYDLELKRQGLQPIQRQKDHAMRVAAVADLMRADGYQSVSGDTPARELLARFMSHRVDVLWVVDAAGRLVGVVDLQDVKGLLLQPNDNLRATDVLIRDVPRLHAGEPISDTVPMFFRSMRAELPVVDPRDALIGVLCERDVVAAYHREVNQNDGLMTRVTTGVPGQRQTDYVELPEGEALEVVEVGERLAGQSLRALKLPSTLGCTVLAMSRWNSKKGRWERRMIEADEPLMMGDRLVVVGERDRVASMSALG